MEYVVFEHGPFNFEEDCETVGKKLEESIKGFDFTKKEYKPDISSGRIGYFYFDPESFEKRIQPVRRN